MILLLGPTGVGKSTLLKLLSNFPDLKQKQSTGFEELPSTIPTVGTNILNLNLGKRNIVELRELGGAMAPLWKSYYTDTTKVIFMIDASNALQVSAASVQIKEILCLSLPTLVVLNKCDVATTMSISELKYLLQLKHLLKNLQCQVTIVELSCKDKSGLNDVFKWLKKS